MRYRVPSSELGEGVPVSRRASKSCQKSLGGPARMFTRSVRFQLLPFLARKVVSCRTQKTSRRSQIRARIRLLPRSNCAAGLPRVEDSAASPREARDGPVE